MKNNAVASDSWLNNLPASHADYLSYSVIELGRHPSAFLIYQDKVRFIKQIPEVVQQKEYAVLAWLEKLQLSSEKLTTDQLTKTKAPMELQIPKPDLISCRTDLLITTKLEGSPLTKVSLLAQLPLVSKVLVYIHRLIEFSSLPNIIMQSIDHQLPSFVDDVIEYKSQFNQAIGNINNNFSILGFIHGDLSVGNILASNTTIGLVDWEYASIRDCRWDLATLAVEFELDNNEFQTLCDSYSELRNLQEISFTSVAKSWSVIYAITCLIWAKKNNQDTNRYIQFLERLEN